MSVKDFQLQNKLGEGAFSSVWKVKRISDGQEYAMKKVKLTPLSEKEKQNAINEVRILASLQSPYIVGYKEAFFEDVPLTLCIVMEYAGGGDIFGKVTQHQKMNKFMPEKDIWRYAVQMIMGLKTLHDMKIVHRDLKCANIFLSTDGKTAKLGDLNVSKVAKDDLLTTQTGTPYYASPEVWKDQPYDSKSDIWSLGCVIYEMCALKPPFRANDMKGLFNKIQRGVFDRIPSQYSIDLYNMISICLQVKPSARLNCDQLLSHPLIQRNGREFLQDLDFQDDGNELLGTIIVPKNIKALAAQLPKANYEDKERGRGQDNKQEEKNILKRPSSQHVMGTKNGVMVRESQSRESRVSRIQKNEAAQVKENEREYLARMQKEFIDQAKPMKPLDMLKSPKQQDILVQYRSPKQEMPVQKKSPKNYDLPPTYKSPKQQQQHDLPPTYKSPNYRIQSGKRPMESPRADMILKKNEDLYSYKSKMVEPVRRIDPVQQAGGNGVERNLVNKQEYLIHKYQSQEKAAPIQRVYSDKADLMKQADILLAKYQQVEPLRRDPNPILERRVYGTPSQGQRPSSGVQQHQYQQQQQQQRPASGVQRTPSNGPKNNAMDLLERYKNALENKVGHNKVEYQRPSSGRNYVNNQEKVTPAIPKKNPDDWSHKKAPQPQLVKNAGRPLWWG